MAWHRSTGPGVYDNVIIHRRATSYGGFTSEYFMTYYQAQSQPSITAFAFDKADMLFRYGYQQGSANIARQHFNGSGWGTLADLGPGAYPSVSQVSSSAKYVYTGGFSSPYTVNLSSETFTKITEEIEPKYSRSIAWLDSSGAYLQVRAEPFRLKMPDGSEQLLDFLPVSLDTFNLTPANSWELLASLPAPLPADAESLLVDFTIDGESLERIAVQPGSTARGAIRLLGRNNQVLATLLGPSFTLSGNLPAARYRLGFALGQIGIPPNTGAVKANVIINGSNASKGIFASLGHIFDFNGQVAPGAPKQTSRTNAAAMSDEEEVPGAFRLESNYPNPFNPSTTIRYQVPRPARIKITVYNLLGEEIRRLVDETVSEGIHEIAWDGRDEQGNFAGSGVYFLRLSAVSGPQQFSDTKKILLVK